MTTTTPNYHSVSSTTVEFLDTDNPLSTELFLFNQQRDSSKSTYPIFIPHLSNYGTEYNLIDKTSITYEPIESFEGYVITVNEEAFVARLTNIMDRTEYEMEILKETITNKSDFKRLEKGAIFFWEISRRKDAEREDVISTLLFRRGPCWSKEEIQRAEEDAKLISNNLGW